jgi:flagellar basal body rod protein FlgG
MLTKLDALLQEKCSEVVKLKPKKTTIANNIDELNTMGYRVICERHSLKQFCSTMSEAKAVQTQHRRQGGCLEAEIKKPRRQ